MQFSGGRRTETTPVRRGPLGPHLPHAVAQTG